MDNSKQRRRSERQIMWESFSIGHKQNRKIFRGLKTAIKYYGMGKDFRVGSGENYTNGEVRMRIYDGDGKGFYKWVFAGNTHEIFQEGLLRDIAGMKLGNFDSIIQGTRRNKYERFRRERNVLTGEENNGKK